MISVKLPPMQPNNTLTPHLQISPVFDAPVEQVWQAWTHPDQIKNWWGPNGFTTTIHKMDLVPGGEWLLTLHGPDGTDFPNRSVFKEVIPGKRIVFEHFAPNFMASIGFEGRGNQTVLTWSMRFESDKLFENILKHHNAEEGQRQNAERLRTFLSGK